MKEYKSIMFMITSSQFKPFSAQKPSLKMKLFKSITLKDRQKLLPQVRYINSQRLLIWPLKEVPRCSTTSTNILLLWSKNIAGSLRKHLETTFMRNWRWPFGRYLKKRDPPAREPLI